MEKLKFELIKKKHKRYASWAIWADEGKRPKSNIGDLSIFDMGINSRFLKHLKPSIVLVGLNISRPVNNPLGNFHDPRPQAMDYKIRYALKNSPFWGAYMTDIIKDFQQKVAGEVMSYLRTAEGMSFEKKNVHDFREEIKDLGVDNPSIIAFGNDAHEVLKRNFQSEHEILKIPHYSNFTAKEKYREEVKSIWENMNACA